MVLHIPILILFFPSFLTWGFHSHFVGIRYIIGGPIGRNVVYSGSLSHSSPYSNNTPYLCFPFFGGWCTYSRSCIKCGSCVFMIVGRVISIRSFSAASEVCNLVSLMVRPLYIIFLGFFTSNSGFCVLGALVGSTSFVELFVVEAFHEYFKTLFSIPMLVDP